MCSRCWSKFCAPNGFVSLDFYLSFFSNSLCSDDTQIALLRDHWVDLFAIGLAQCAQTLSLPTIMSSLIHFLKTSIAQDKIAPAKIKKFTENVWRLQEFVQGVHRLEPDDCEYAYLKLLAVFSTGKMFVNYFVKWPELSDWIGSVGWFILRSIRLCFDSQFFCKEQTINILNS